MLFLFWKPDKIIEFNAVGQCLLATNLLISRFASDKPIWAIVVITKPKQTRNTLKV